MTQLQCFRMSLTWGLGTIAQLRGTRKTSVYTTNVKREIRGLTTFPIFLIPTIVVRTLSAWIARSNQRCAEGKKPCGSMRDTRPLAALQRDSTSALSPSSRRLYTASPLRCTAADSTSHLSQSMARRVAPPVGRSDALSVKSRGTRRALD